MRQKPKSVVRQTQADFAKPRGISQQAISKRLAKSDSMAAKLEAAKLRKWQAEAALLELEKAQTEEQLLDPELVLERLNKCLSIVAQYIKAGEAELPRLVNPTDPELARKEYAKWALRFWPLVREKQKL